MKIQKIGYALVTVIAGFGLVHAEVSANTKTSLKQGESVTTRFVSSPEEARTYEELLAYYSNLNALDKARAKSWRLTEKEYGRYRLLKETSPRGIWTPNIDPITLLGVESRTEQERLKYARLFNQIELARTKQDIAFGFAQNEDVKRLSPNSNAFKSYLEQRDERRVNYMNINKISQGSPDSNADYKSTSYLVYIDLLRDCEKDCARQINQVIKFDRVDFFFINAASDQAIIDFAKTHKLPSQKVKSGVFKLNYANEEQVPFMPGSFMVHKITGNDDAVRVIL